MVAISVVRLTRAAATPSTAISARSTRVTQPPQVMPSMRNRVVVVGDGAWLLTAS